MLTSGTAALPTMTLLVEGKSYGGAYWSDEEYQVSFEDLGDHVGIVATTSDGALVQGTSISQSEAVDFTCLWPLPDVSVPGVQVTPSWNFHDGRNEIMLTDLNEVVAWLRYWLGWEVWNPEDEEWAY